MIEIRHGRISDLCNESENVGLEYVLDCDAIYRWYYTIAIVRPYRYGKKLLKSGLMFWQYKHMIYGTVVSSKNTIWNFFIIFSEFIKQCIIRDCKLLIKKVWIVKKMLMYTHDALWKMFAKCVDLVQNFEKNLKCVIFFKSALPQCMYTVHCTY